MGNQIKKLTSISNAHQNGFMRVNSNLESTLSENEFNFGIVIIYFLISKLYYFVFNF